MTDVDVLNFADTEQLAQPDTPLQPILRRKVVPGYLADVGYAGWRRIYGSASIAPGGRTVQLPSDFWELRECKIALPGASTAGIPPLRYIGSIPGEVIDSESNTFLSVPTGYYLTHSAATPALYNVLRLDAPADQAYTLYYIYFNGIFFADDTAPYDFSNFIPVQFQWALVEGLRKELFYRRFGQQDARFQAAQQEYQRFVAISQGRNQADLDLAARDSSTKRE